MSDSQCLDGNVDSSFHVLPDVSKMTEFYESTQHDPVTQLVTHRNLQCDKCVRDRLFDSAGNSVFVIFQCPVKLS